jgi:hypothetical protein
MLDENRPIVRHLCMAGLFFLFMVIVFSFGRKPIGSLNNSLLALTDELRVGEGGAEGGEAWVDGGVAAQSGAGGKPAAAVAAPDMFKPTFTDLPKTAPVYAVLLDSLPGSGKDPRLVAAPPLRNYTGLAWIYEQTDLYFASDGRTLYLWAYCHDRNPADLYTEATKTKGANVAWQDDSIEFFLMRDTKASYYVQYIVSASGASVVLYLAVDPSKPQMGRVETLPAGFRLPYVECDVLQDGYRIVMEIDLGNLEIDRISPDEQILCQLVRNYRSEQDPNSVNLQLFPEHIYADNRFREFNHHRSAFQPLTFITPARRAKLPPPPPPDPFTQIVWE